MMAKNESGKGFNILFMDWEEFKEIIISRTTAVMDNMIASLVG